MIHVTQYKTRKLYLNTIRRYTNLNELKELVQSGETIEVTDYSTGKDVTAHVLSQCLVLTNKTNAAEIADMIRRGE